jgi:hypothetical protein
MAMNHRLVIPATAVLLALVLAGCSDDPDANPEPDLPDLAGMTSEWACGRGFWVGNSDQTVTLRLDAVDVESLILGDRLDVGATGSASWTGALVVGRDLYANWCDDAIEPDEPVPVIEEQWQVEGTVEMTVVPPAGECGEAQAWARDLVATSSDGRTLEIGDLLVNNAGWGCFAG